MPVGAHRYTRAVTLRWRTALALGVGFVAAAAAKTRMRPSALPSPVRRLLSVPRPLLTASRLRTILEPAPGERILEVGAGTGYYALALAEDLQPGAVLDAFDLQPVILHDLTHRAHARRSDNIVATQGDARSLPYADASFDAAYLVTVLHEIPNQERALQEVSRVLRPGGRLVIGDLAPGIARSRRSLSDRSGARRRTPPPRPERARGGELVRGRDERRPGARALEFVGEHAVGVDGDRDRLETRVTSDCAVHDPPRVFHRDASHAARSEHPADQRGALH